MKAYREDPKPVFNYIHLIIETEEEAIILWHRLNVSKYSTLADYYKGSSRHDVEGESGIGLAAIMYRAITSVFSP